MILREITLPSVSCRRPVSISWLIRALTWKISPFVAVLGTCTRGMGLILFCLTPSSRSGAAISGDVNPGLGHQQRAIIHLGKAYDILRLGKADARRDARLAALREEMKSGDL